VPPLRTCRCEGRSVGNSLSIVELCFYLNSVMGNRLINPYTIYVASFGGALLLYSLHWSTYYPPLQNSLIIFLLISFFAGWFAAKRFMGRSNRDFTSIPSTGIRQVALISIF